jgi:hypothetical protein
MADFYATGTVSVSNGSTTVTGSGVLWSDVRAGDTLELAGQRVTIAATPVSPYTSLTLALAWTGTTQSGASYYIRYDAPSRFTAGYLATQVRSLIERTSIIESAAPTYTVQAVTNTPPGSPVADDTYAVGNSPSGAWSANAGKLAQWTGSAWTFTTPEAGWLAYAVGDGQYVYDGGWVPQGDQFHTETLTDAWLNGKAPNVVSRAAPRFLTPEMYIGLDTQIIYCPGGEVPDFSGATDFKPAFDAMRDEMLTLLEDVEWPPTSSYGWKRHKFGIALQPGFRYAVDGPINFTGFQTRGLVFQGNGAQIIGRFDDGAVLDLLGSAGWRVRDLSIESSTGLSPDLGVLFGREFQGASKTCEGMLFDSVRVDGWWRKAGVYNSGSELFTYINPSVYSYRTDVPALWIDCQNELDVATLTASTVADVAQGVNESCIQHTIIGGYLRNIQENQYGAVRIDGSRDGDLNTTRGVKLIGTYFTNNGTDTDAVRPAVRIRGMVDDVLIDGHGELSNPTDSIVNLSHILYFDLSDTGTTHKFSGIKVRDYFSDAEIAVIGKSNTDTIELADFECSIAYSRGAYPSGTPAKLFGSNFTSATARISGKITTGDVPSTFINLNDVTFNGTLETLEVMSGVGVGLPGRININTTDVAGGSYVKQATKLITSNGTVAVEGHDKIVLSGSVTAVSFSNGFRYHSFECANGTSNDVTISGLAGPNIVLSPGQAVVISQYQTTFYVASGSYSGVYTPTCTNNSNVASFTTHPLRVFRLGKYVQVSGLIQISATAGSDTATSFNMTLPFASALTGAQQLTGSGAVIGQNRPVGVLGDATNDRAQVTLVAPASGALNLSISFSYEVL